MSKSTWQLEERVNNGERMQKTRERENTKTIPHAVLPDAFVISNQWLLRDSVVLVPVHASFEKKLQKAH
jgi:hypothetical protein